MHPVVFSAEWFEHHQGKLLWLLNHWLTRRWFRWVLCIRSCDIGYATTIVELFPHAYTVLLRDRGNGQLDVSTDFRTHHKYAKRLYYAFRPLWWMLHFWDWLLADRMVPRLSFGFATLTVFPDPDQSATTVDGSVIRNGVDETLAVIRAGAGASAGNANATDNAQLLGSTTSNQFSALRRLVFTFDTHLVQTIVSGSLSLFGSSKNTSLGSPDMHIAGATPAANNILAAADYSQVQTTSFSSIANASISTSAYNIFSLNASGLSNVSSTISRFSGQLSWDILNSFGGVWVASTQSNITFVMADTAGTANDPKLDITYTLQSRLASQFDGAPNRIRPRFFRPGMAR
jgi:hypothetical protein